MSKESNISNPEEFSKALFEIMKQVDLSVNQMVLYEFRYTLNHMIPEGGWESVRLEPRETIEAMVTSDEFYDRIKIKEKVRNRIALDATIKNLTNMLFVGLLTGDYDIPWVQKHFAFDIRGFFFLHRTNYFTEEVVSHLNGKPYRQFEITHDRFDAMQDIGYKDFQTANQEVDTLFIESVQKLISRLDKPLLFAVAGPTAAGKTEIVERLRAMFEAEGKKVTAVELDNFLTDRDYREKMGIYSRGRQAYHFEHFKQALIDIRSGKDISIPRYDFVYATSSHDLEGNLKPDGVPIEIESGDIIFIEGNFPFLYEEIAELIAIKVVYITADRIRFKRKWKRDIDYRKKYEPRYFCNRYFKDQFIMAGFSYRPQMAVADIVVDTSGAALWTSEEIAEILDGA